MGINLTPEERFEVFGDFNPDDHAAEVEERWGDTDAYRESAKRTARYTKADWEEVKAESDRVHAAFTDAMDAGEPPTSTAAMDAAEQHRASMQRFYDCSYDLQRNLADMYVSDPRFIATYDEIRPGMSHYVRDAIHANADRHQS